jgi:predicted metal-dependent phosphoesterase TrpH
VKKAGGITSLAHPIRVSRRLERGDGHGKHDDLDQWVAELREIGLGALEVFHSDHRPPDVARFQDMARRFELAVTGGSDFHGANKPRIELGLGFEGNLNVPRSVLDRLRSM